MPNDEPKTFVFVVYEIKWRHSIAHGIRIRMSNLAYLRKTWRQLYRFPQLNCAFVMPPRKDCSPQIWWANAIADSNSRLNSVEFISLMATLQVLFLNPLQMHLPVIAPVVWKYCERKLLRLLTASSEYEKIRHMCECNALKAWFFILSMCPNFPSYLGSLGVILEDCGEYGGNGESSLGNHNFGYYDLGTNILKYSY